MKKIAVINDARCDKSPFCPVKRICPVGAVTQEIGKAPVINHDLCIGCGICEQICPMKAVSIK